MSARIEIVPFHQELLPAAAALFQQEVEALRRRVPALPDQRADLPTIIARLAQMMTVCPGVMALEQGALVGYLGWWIVEHFRGTARRGAYCPEWAHGARAGQKQTIYQALYRAAATQWAAQGCQVHAVTLLAHDQAAERAWFWQGFGLTVVDAVRPMQPLCVAHPAGLVMRPATTADVALLVTLDAEHCLHYAQSPVLMAPRAGRDAAAWRHYLAHSQNNVWLALEGGRPAGFLAFASGDDYDGADLLCTAGVVGITGAYVRPAYRGRGVASALLDAALQAYARQGMTSCAINFESFNPEAALFWPRYFTPVCLSLLRMPEWVAGVELGGGHDHQLGFCQRTSAMEL